MSHLRTFVANQVLSRIRAFLGVFCPDFYSDIEDFTQILCRYLSKISAAGTSGLDLQEKPSAGDDKEVGISLPGHPCLLSKCSLATLCSSCCTWCKSSHSVIRHLAWLLTPSMLSHLMIFASPRPPLPSFQYPHMQQAG